MVQVPDGGGSELDVAGCVALAALWSCMFCRITASGMVPVGGAGALMAAGLAALLVGGGLGFVAGH